MTPTLGELPARTSDALVAHQNRNLEMQLSQKLWLVPQMQQRLREAEHERRSMRLLAAQRLQRRRARLPACPARTGHGRDAVTASAKPW